MASGVIVTPLAALFPTLVDAGGPTGPGAAALAAAAHLRRRRGALRGGGAEVRVVLELPLEDGGNRVAVGGVVELGECAVQANW